MEAPATGVDGTGVDEELATLLGARRDGFPGADTSRGLLLTALGEYALPAGGEVWTQTLVDALGLVGVRDKAARQAIARLHDRGWLERRRVGRRTRWRLTRPAVELLESGAERIYGFGTSPPPWDGRWLVLLASVPERDRSIRYRMGVELGWAGFGSLGQGVWLSPWLDREGEVVDALRRLGVEATTFRSELGALGSGPALVDQAWNLTELQRKYDDFVATATRATTATAPTAPAATGGEAAVAELTTLVHRWRRFPFLDPDLPADLLPADWPRPLAARAFSERRAALLGPARRWWESAEADLTPLR